MDKELYNRLKVYESYLITAKEADYIRGLTNSQIEDMISIGNALGIFYKNNHCPKCALEFVKKLAVPFYAAKKQMEETKNEKRKTTNKPKRNGKKTPDTGSNSEG